MSESAQPLVHGWFSATEKTADMRERLHVAKFRFFLTTGKSAVKVTSLDKTTPIENIRLVQNSPSDTAKLLEWFQSDHEEDKKDLRFRRNRNALVVLLLIEAARQGDQASNGEFRNIQ